MYSGEYDACDVTLSAGISTPGRLQKYAWPRARWESNRLHRIDYIDIEGTILSSEISHTRTDLNA